VSAGRSTRKAAFESRGSTRVRLARVVAAGVVLALGCEGGGNAAPSIVDLSIWPEPPMIPLPGGLQLYPYIADEAPGSCQVTWTLKVWDGTWNAVLREPRLVDAVPGAHIGAAEQATKATQGETPVQFDVIQPGWYTVQMTVRDSEDASSTVIWDFTSWCEQFDFGQCELLPVGDPSDFIAPSVDLTRLTLKGTVTDHYGGTVASMSMAPPGTVTLVPPGGMTCAFTTSAIDCPGVAILGIDNVTVVTLTAVDTDLNVSMKEFVIREHVP